MLVNFHYKEAGEEAVRFHVQQVAAIPGDGELPTEPLGRDRAGDDGSQGEAALGKLVNVNL